MKRKTTIIGFALACLLIIAIVGMMTPWKAAAKIATPQPVMQSDVGVPSLLSLWKNYSTTFLIGEADTNSFVAPGTYKTHIKIHNYSEHSAAVVVKAMKGHIIGPPCVPGPISPWVYWILGPDENWDIDSFQIRMFLSDNTTDYYDGFLQIAYRPAWGATLPFTGADISAIRSVYDENKNSHIDIENHVPQITLPAAAMQLGVPGQIATTVQDFTNFHIITITVKTAGAGASAVPFARVNVSFTCTPPCGPNEFPTLTAGWDGVVRIGLFHCDPTTSRHIIFKTSNGKSTTLDPAW